MCGWGLVNIVRTGQFSATAHPRTWDISDVKIFFNYVVLGLIIFQIYIECCTLLKRKRFWLQHGLRPRIKSWIRKKCRWKRTKKYSFQISNFHLCFRLQGEIYTRWDDIQRIGLFRKQKRMRARPIVHSKVRAVKWSHLFRQERQFWYQICNGFILRWLYFMWCQLVV